MFAIIKKWVAHYLKYDNANEKDRVNRKLNQKDTYLDRGQESGGRQRLTMFGQKDAKSLIKCHTVFFFHLSTKEKLLEHIL